MINNDLDEGRSSLQGIQTVNLRIFQKILLAKGDKTSNVFHLVYAVKYHVEKRVFLNGNARCVCG